MPTQLFGIMLLVLGLRYLPMQAMALGGPKINQQLAAAIAPAVISPTGTTTNLNSSAGAPVSGLTKEQISAYVSDSWKEERNNASISQERITQMQQAFMDKRQQLDQKSATANTAFENVMLTFTDTQRMNAVESLNDSYGYIILKALSYVENQSESLLILLDDCSAVSKALQNQGIDVSRVMSDISSSREKLYAAIKLNGTLMENLTLVLPVTDEASAGQQILTAIADTKAQFVPVNTAFADADKSVGVVLSDLELMTKSFMPYE